MRRTKPVSLHSASRTCMAAAFALAVASTASAQTTSPQVTEPFERDEQVGNLPNTVPPARETPDAELQSEQVQAAQAQLDNEEVAGAVRSALRLDPALAGERINVTADNGRIILTGSVPNLPSLRRAEQIAETVRGVATVANELSVPLNADRSDEQLRLDVTASLAGVAAAQDVEIRAENGIIVLTGSAPSLRVARTAERAAGEVNGVIAVRNQIQINRDEARPDDAIAQEVASALRWNELVDDGLINVAVADGAVALSGSVASAAERRQAIDAAHVDGVASVDASALQVARWQRDPQLSQDKYGELDPAQVAAAVTRAIESHGTLAAEDIGVTLEGNTITLIGKVQTVANRRHAAQVARTVVGVHEVENRLEVQASDNLNSTTIAASVKEALDRDAYVAAQDIGVEVKDGVATLTGTVPSRLFRRRADDVAARVAGVQRVQNLVEVEDASNAAWVASPYTETTYAADYDWYTFEPGETDQSDAAIHDAIRQQLYWNPLVNELDVTVVVQDGVATLTGRVNSLKERMAAEQDAFQGGAVQVRNNLEIGPPPQVEVEAQVETEVEVEAAP